MISGRNLLVWGVVLLAFGCEDDGGDGTGQELEQDIERRVRPQDAMVTPDEGELPPDEGLAEDAAPPDAEADGAIRSVEGCADVCGVYDTCGRTADLWGGDSATCLAACEDAEASPRFGSFVACIQVTPCERLHECLVPDRPLPTCARVCEAIDGCEAEFRLPVGHPDFADCAAACDDGQVTRFMSECGANLPDADPAACDEPVFARCLLNQIGAECLALCEQRALCEDADDPVDCAVECLQNPRDPGEDPVARRRADQDRACLFNALTCDDVRACAERAPPMVDQVAVDAICAANEECAFFPAEGCPEAVAELLPKLAEGGSDCLLTGLTERCGEPIYECFGVAVLEGAECEELCLVQDICGLLPDEQNEFLCLEACQGAIRDDLPGAASFRRQFPCAFRDSCEAVEACLALASPEAVCVEVCNAEIACQHPGDGECNADCQANFDSVRVRAETACVQAGEGCEAQARCITPEPADCTLLCDPAVACGADAGNCALACDDEAFADRAGFAARVACVHSSARCADVTACLEDAPARGGECLGWCAQDADCAVEDPAAFEGCAADCGANSPAEGYDSLVFDNARGCLAELGADAVCGDYAECLDGAEFLSYCERFCGELDRCGLDDDGEACLQACRGAGVGPFLDEAACALNAERRRAGCAPVAECVGAEVEPADEDCAALCAAQQACDEDVDIFLCERGCTPSPEGTALRAVCAGRADCESLPLCLEAAAEPPAGCVDVCATIEACDGLLGEGDEALYADVDACLAACGGTAVLEEEDYVGLLGECVETAMCGGEAIAQCFESPEPICQEAWAALLVCGSQDILGGGNEAMFLADCQMNLQMNGDAARITAQCLIDASAGDPASCLVDQIFCSF